MTPEKKLILNAEKDTSEHIWIKRNQNWTADDNGVCKRAEESGIFVNKKTNKQLTFQELKSMTFEYDNKAVSSIDDFLKKKTLDKIFDSFSCV